jgi:hypothetical protein
MPDTLVPSSQINFSMLDCSRARNDALLRSCAGNVPGHRGECVLHLFLRSIEGPDSFSLRGWGFAESVEVNSIWGHLNQPHGMHGWSPRIYLRPLTNGGTGGPPAPHATKQ